MPHRALMVDEILREVTAQVTWEHRSTAIALACCAKFFEEPALSALWKIPDLELPNLIKTLPHDCWDLQIGEAEDSLTLTRIPSRDEWARFLRYASWIRDLTFPFEVTISSDVFRQLSIATSGGLVCPQLQHLTWTSSYGWEPMRQFLSPYLMSVVFYGEYGMKPDTYPALATTISLLPTTYLEDLNLNVPSPSIHIPKLSEVVRRLSPCFEQLSTWSPLSDAAWEHLASLPKLEWLRVSDTPCTDISKSIRYETAFPALLRMEIKASSVHQYWSFLFSLLKSSPIQEVTVETGRRIQGADVPGQVITAILEAELQRSVKDLSFSGSDPADLTSISYLGRFSSLNKLRWTTQCQRLQQRVSLTDSDVEQLASCLPQLVTLWLGHSSCKSNHHNTTIKSLISFSTHCPSLDELCFPCDLTNTPEDVKTEWGKPDLRLEIRSPCKLRFLAFVWITMPPPDDIEASRIVTSALDHLFPVLESSPAETRAV